MHFSGTRLLVALFIPALAALGGGAVVFSGIDDAPGGVGMGILLILGAAALSVRAGLRSA